MACLRKTPNRHPRRVFVLVSLLASRWRLQVRSLTSRQVDRTRFRSM